MFEKSPRFVSLLYFHTLWFAWEITGITADWAMKSIEKYGKDSVVFRDLNGEYWIAIYRMFTTDEILMNHLNDEFDSWDTTFIGKMPEVDG